MLCYLQIRDFGLIDRAEVELGPGLTVLTGETGAGKSMLVDALGLLLGDRAEPRMIRDGAERAEISGEFDTRAIPLAARWLRRHEIDDEGQCLIRRVIAREGRSRIHLNGTPVTRQRLRELGLLLADIHGQHEHQSLLRLDQQRRMLDARGQLDELAQAVAGAHEAWRAIERERARLAAELATRSEHLALLRFQAAELAELEPRDDEPTILEREHRLLADAAEVRLVAMNAADRLYDADDGNAHDLVARSLRELDGVIASDLDLQPHLASLEEAMILLRDAADGLRQRADTVTEDPARLAEVERRLERLYEAARKYRVPPAGLAAKLRELQQELGDDLDPATVLGRLESEATELGAGFREAAARLTEGRRAAARTLANEVTGTLGRLGMPGGRFDIELLPLPEATGSPSGNEQVQFLVSANPGQPLQPLNRVASGGELSRISLAIQSATAASLAVPSLVYDEVDIGIGGSVAEIVGKLLRELAHDRQVLCITHLPQVAAQGERHLQVLKRHDGERTRTTVAELTGDQRVQELARMLGGVRITDQTRAHAEEMIALAR